MPLTGAQRQQLITALTDAFPDPDDLEMMVSVGLNKNLYTLVGRGSTTTMAFKLIRWAESQGVVQELLDAARTVNADNLLLRTMVQRVGDELYLERIVMKSVGFANAEQWIEQVRQCLYTICKIEVPLGVAQGTGFLLGPTILITNYHVLEEILLYPQRTGKVVLRFDYRVGADGQKLHEGVEYTLVPETWLIAASPIRELDYVLVSIQKRSEANDQANRRWLIPRRYMFTRGESLLIVQHPQGIPLQTAWGTVIEIAADQRQLFYTTNTLEGSSGSPCFASDGSLVALHQGYSSASNRGIPFTVILEDLRTKNLVDVLGE